MDTVKQFPDPQSMAAAAARRFVDLAAVNVKAKDQFNVVLAGGSTPRLMYELLASTHRGAVEWENVCFFWGDERSVPGDHPDSNYRMARVAMLDHLALPAENVHPIPGEREPDEAAREYASILRSHFKEAVTPEFDLVLLGMGEDGHTASLFPYTDALQIRDQPVTANYVPRMDTWRITLTIPVINAAHNVLFLVSGQSKADALRAVLAGPYSPRKYPAQFISPQNGELKWYVDDAAAALL